MCDHHRPPQPVVQAVVLGGKTLVGNYSGVIKILSVVYLFGTHLTREMLKLAWHLKAWWRERRRKLSPGKKAIANIMKSNNSRKQKR